MLYFSNALSSDLLPEIVTITMNKTQFHVLYMHVKFYLPIERNNIDGVCVI
jgi:hypothetical protein